MWIFTKDGFFSVVQDNYCGDDELMVRARVKKDLASLLKKIGTPKKKAILTIDHADYRYRVKVKKDDWVKYVAHQALDIDYSNVKGTLIDHNDHGRATAYYGCWESMHSLQSGRQPRYPYSQSY